MKFITLIDDNLTQIVNVDQIENVRLEQAENSKSWLIIIELKNDRSFVSVGDLDDTEEQFNMISSYLKSYDYRDVFYEMKNLKEYSKKQE